MKTKPVVLFFAVAFFAVCSCAQKKETGQPVTATAVYEGIEFEMPQIREPLIPDNVVTLTDFGAVSGGQVLNSAAFAAAIDAVSQKGGGKVIIPAGIWLTGPIILKSNLELFTEPGALVIFSTDKDLYPVIQSSFEGLNTWRCISPIYGKDIENVAFTGKGVWDGSGDAWRFVKRSKMTDSQWKDLVASGGVVNEKNTEWYPSAQFRDAMKNTDQNVRMDMKTKEEFETIRDFLRPVMVKIENSKRIKFDGPTFQNSPAWCIHPMMVEDLTVRNITVRNPWYSQNGDGIDIESCNKVIVENSNFDVGDDAICIKSGKDEEGRLRGIPSENLVIRNNIVYHGHGGVTVGSEMSGGVRNMHVSNCTFIGTDVGLRFKSNRGRGGVVENIFISGIQMIKIPTHAISFDLYYGGQSVSEMLESGKTQNLAEAQPVTEETPQFKNISMKNITVKGALQAVFMQGLPEMNLENIMLSGMILEADNGFSLVDVDGITLENINLKTKSGKAFEIFNAKNTSFKNVVFNSEAASAITINGQNCKNIQLNSGEGKIDKSKVQIGGEVPAEAVKF
jgi:polygalacturonase